MKKPPLRSVALGIGVLVALLILLRVSSILFGPWWRASNMPTADEWSALWGVFGLAAVAIAVYQLRQVDQSNRALAVANDVARKATVESIRPRVIVNILASRDVPSKRGSPAQGVLYVCVENIGASPALDVRLEVDGPFESLPIFFKPGRMAAALDSINEQFDGSVRYETLVPGRKYIWYLGWSNELFKDKSGVRRKYNVTARYGSTSSGEQYVDPMVLDLDVEKHLEGPPDPLIRIGRDIEVVGNRLDELNKSVKALKKR